MRERTARGSFGRGRRGRRRFHRVAQVSHVARSCPGGSTWGGQGLNTQDAFAPVDFNARFATRHPKAKPERRSDRAERTCSDSLGPIRSIGIFRICIRHREKSLRFRCFAFGAAFPVAALSTQKAVLSDYKDPVRKSATRQARRRPACGSCAAAGARGSPCDGRRGRRVWIR